ncbi:MAG: hypothetical protein ACYCQI_16190, partial [Gammaproteobacteria bacterium]
MSTARYTLRDLELAISKGDFELARHLIEDCKMDPRNSADDYFGQLAHATNASSKETIEAQANSEKLLDLLFKAGVDINASFDPARKKNISNGARALEFVLENLSWKKDPSIMDVRINIINKLLDKKMDVNNVITMYGKTALALAAESGHMEICK